MKRRAIVVASSAWLLGLSVPSFAQAPKVARRIAVLLPGTEQGHRSVLEAFRTALKDLGYVEGRDISIEARLAEGKIDRLGSLAAEVVALNPAVIVTGTSAALAAAKRATSRIPIVFATAGSPVEQGFVSSLRRPGGNITGIMLHLGLAAKIAELAREALPRVQRLAILVHDADHMHKLYLDLFVPSAQRFKFEPVVLRVARAEDLDRAFKELADHKADALYLPQLAFMVTNRDQLVARSLKARLPLLSHDHDITVDGGLMSYGSWREENYHRAAALVDKILRGANPGDLPVEQPERIQLVVNMKTAKAIGVTLSKVTMLRADRVIE